MTIFVHHKYHLMCVQKYIFERIYNVLNFIISCDHTFSGSNKSII